MTHRAAGMGVCGLRAFPNSTFEVIPAVAIIDDSAVWHVKMDGRRRNRLEACLPRPPLSGTGRRGRLSSCCLACHNGWQVKKQAGSLFAETTA
jgi:hypothetical protein